MRYEEIVDRLNSLGLPVAKNAFRKTSKTPLPDLPYIVYLIPQQIGRGADAINNIKEMQISIELYTDKISDDELERQIEEAVLYDVEYIKYQTTIESEEMIQTAYEFTIICK